VQRDAAKNRLLVNTMASKLDTLERLLVQDRHELRSWLELHHASSPGMWLVTYRAATAKPRPRYDEIVDELVSFGWIDGRLMKLDESMSMLLCTPRNPRSHWSSIETNSAWQDSWTRGS
jgi:uncharacterized protein YdeI (YjbR/CyaY-like superfamily)